MANGRKANGKWVDRWREGGRHRQRTFDRRGDRDAFRRERIRRQQLGGLVALERDVTLGEFIEDYWRLQAVPNLESKTRELYRQQWGKHIQPRVGDYALRAITPKLVNRELVAPMRSAGVGEPTIRQALMVLQAIFTYAHAEDRVPDNPIRRVTKPRQTVEREVSPVAPATVERLRTRLGTRDAVMVAVLAYAGLRPQELLALRWDDVVDGALRIRRRTSTGSCFRTPRRARTGA